jgi:hypothetical protein
MTFLRNILITLALGLFASQSFANKIGEMVCPECKLTAPYATPEEMNAAVKYANDNFPKSFQPSHDDIILVCNRQLCIRVVWRNAKWNTLGNVTATDITESSGRNYLNGKQGGMSSVSPFPSTGLTPTTDVVTTYTAIDRHVYVSVDGGAMYYAGSHIFWSINTITYTTMNSGAPGWYWDVPT